MGLGCLHGHDLERRLGQNAGRIHAFLEGKPESRRLLERELIRVIEVVNQASQVEIGPNAAEEVAIDAGQGGRVPLALDVVEVAVAVGYPEGGLAAGDIEQDDIASLESVGRVVCLLDHQVAEGCHALWASSPAVPLVINGLGRRRGVDREAEVHRVSDFPVEVRWVLVLDATVVVASHADVICEVVHGVAGEWEGRGRGGEAGAQRADHFRVLEVGVAEVFEEVGGDDSLLEAFRAHVFFVAPVCEVKEIARRYAPDCGDPFDVRGCLMSARMDKVR